MPRDPQFRCHFCDSGFTLESRRYSPCAVSYHPACLRIGVPFATRLDDDKGLSCPPDSALYKGFICESCRVRLVLRRELHRAPLDVALLMLERATTVDIYNHWSHGTMKTYKSKYRVLQDFERDFHVHALPRPHMKCPPDTESRPLMWAQERYALYPARWKRSAGLPSANVKWGTVRALRSAAAFQSTFNLMQSIPERLVYGFRDKPTVLPACNPTDELVYTVFADGMKRRIGDKTNPSAILLDQHITWMNRHFIATYQAATALPACLATCRAAITNLLAWLAWLRALETFEVRWGGVAITRPEHGPREGLPLGMGIVQVNLQGQTKSSQARMVDMVLAYLTCSGKNLAWWLETLWDILPYPLRVPSGYVICHDNGTPWTSHYFRHNYVYPLLALQRSLGDPYLHKFDETIGRGLR
jgi:hypothetical protein